MIADCMVLFLAVLWLAAIVAGLRRRCPLVDDAARRSKQVEQYCAGLARKGGGK